MAGVDGLCHHYTCIMHIDSIGELKTIVVGTLFSVTVISIFSRFFFLLIFFISSRYFAIIGSVCAFCSLRSCVCFFLFYSHFACYCFFNAFFHGTFLLLSYIVFGSSSSLRVFNVLCCSFFLVFFTGVFFVFFFLFFAFPSSHSHLWRAFFPHRFVFFVWLHRTNTRYQRNLFFPVYCSPCAVCVSASSSSRMPACAPPYRFLAWQCKWQYA